MASNTRTIRDGDVDDPKTEARAEHIRIGLKFIMPALMMWT